jgi:uncharacterized oxidoreductase
MHMTGNTILITGGGSGIGRALAEAFHSKGNTVIIAGRRKALLEEVVAANAGMKAIVFDINSKDSIQALVEQLNGDYPQLNMVIHNAGIMKAENMLNCQVEDAEAMITTNLLGPIRLSAALIPLLIKQASSTLITVSSGLAFVPLAMTPTYCATKAALHSYTQSLRHQLKDTSIKVLEIAPPYVQTELMGPEQLSDPRAMPLKEFIAETMHILEHSQGETEICVERVRPLRFVEANGDYDNFFKNLQNF